jgi:acyl carrier protein
LRTGDLAAMLEGELFITGRLKDLIIIHGRNHYPTDIEKTAEASHEALRTDNSAAFSVTVHGEEQLVVTAEVERTHRRNLDIDATAAVVREAIAKEHEVPVYAIVFLRPGAMLKTSSGKIQRSGCKQAFLNESLNSIGEWRATGFSSSGAGQAPSTDSPFSEQNTDSLQTWIAQWISYRRGVPVEDISPDASFASIGLDSVDSVQLMAALESWVGNTLDTNEMWELENSADLVAYLLAPKESASKQSTESIEGFI